MVQPMERVFDAYAHRKGVSVSTLRFLLDGERIAHDDTPASLRLGHHDQIDCMREQPTPDDWPFPRNMAAVASENEGVPVSLN